MIDKLLMKNRVKLYGNNFPKIAKLWNDYLKSKSIDVTLSPLNVAYMMSLMKKTRLMNQLEKNQYITDVNDYNNYKYISLNYEEYVLLTK